MTETSDGFAIAREDLKIRGPGEFFGVEQHGMPYFKVASLVSDLKILEDARKAARELTETDPGLKSADHESLRGYLKECFKGRFGFVKVG